MRTLMFSLILAIPAAAMGQTASDLARLSGSAAAPVSVEAPRSSTPVGGGSAWNLARLNSPDGAASGSTNALPAALAEAHGFTAADLAQLSGLGHSAPRETPEMVALLRSPK